MQRTTVQPARPNNNNWCNPRIGADLLSRYANQTVILVGTTRAVDSDKHLVTIEDFVSGETVVIQGTVPGSEFTCINEIVVNVDAQGAPRYVAHGMLNDEFDKDAYVKLVKLIRNHHSELFETA